MGGFTSTNLHLRQIHMGIITDQRGRTGAVESVDETDHQDPVQAVTATIWISATVVDMERGRRTQFNAWL